MNDQNKSPLQREFEQSETYRTIREVGGRVMQELNNAGITTESVNHGINKAAEGLNRAVNTISREFGTNTQQHTVRQNNPQPGNTQNPSGGYRYAPQPGSPQNQTRPPYVQPVPAPQRPRMEMRRRPSNVKFWVTGAVCALYSLTMPMVEWYHLIPLALVGVGAFALCNAIFRGKKYYVPVEEPKPEPVKKPEPKPEPAPAKKVNTGDPEVDKIIEEGYEYLKQLRTANDRIEDEAMSRRIERMEAASADIFAYITEHPEKAAQIRRFMNYYLPTTLKLLTSYDKLSRQSVKGENIQKTMFEIEGMMETIAGAFEKQLDSLFHEDAMDIAADISVMESILKQEGLSGDDTMPKVKTGGKTE